LVVYGEADVVIERREERIGRVSVEVNGSGG
jgi:hypothetical protein